MKKRMCGFVSVLLVAVAGAGRGGRAFAQKLGADPVYCWAAQPNVQSYQVVRSDRRDFGGGCDAVSVAGTCHFDAAVPSPGACFFYLERAFLPQTGGWGPDSNGQERIGVCTAPCTDNVHDWSETDVDCGGGICPACGTTQSCGTANDCQSRVCTSGACVAA